MRSVDPETRELIWAARTLGWSVQKIAEYFGVHVRTVMRVLSESESKPIRERVQRRRRELESVA